MTDALLSRSVGLLHALYSPERGLFSATARLDGKRIVNDFKGAAAIRYTIGNLVALQRCPDADRAGWDVDAALTRFQSTSGARLDNLGDRGLLLHALATAGRGEDVARALAEATHDTAGLRGVPLQDLCWLLLGLVRHTEVTGSERSAAASRTLHTLLEREYLDHDSLLPYSASNPVRRRFVSFGAIAYFLQSLYEYGRVLGDRYARTLFAECARTMIALQGRQGEWAWFYDTRRGAVVDWYEIYTVHQLAMAPFWLLPALDEGVETARDAIRLGYRWATGANEAGTPMILEEPFFTHRSLRRPERWPRPRRYARAAGRSLLRRTADRIAAPEVNRECRSYEIGWIVYAWSGRRDTGAILG